MDTANHIIVSEERQTMHIMLHYPLTIKEIWETFKAAGKRAALITMAKGIARVTF